MAPLPPPSSISVAHPIWFKKSSWLKTFLKVRDFWVQGWSLGLWILGLKFPATYQADWIERPNICTAISVICNNFLLLLHHHLMQHLPHPFRFRIWNILSIFMKIHSVFHAFWATICIKYRKHGSSSFSHTFPQCVGFQSLLLLDLWDIRFMLWYISLWCK